MDQRPSGKYLAGFLAALIASLLTLAACEFILRVLKRPNSYVVPWPAANLVWRRTVHQKSEIPGLDYELRPNARAENNGVYIRINRLGMRGDEVPLRKPAGQKRILVLGDSMTFGLGVPDRDTYVENLNRLLEKHFPASQVRALNLGVSGYTSRDEALVLKNRAAQFDPDLVIVGYVLNDPEVGRGQPMHAFYHEHSWWQYSNLLSLLVLAWEKTEILIRFDGSYVKYLHQKPEKWRSVTETFSEMSEWSGQHGTPVLVVILPLITAPLEKWPREYPYQDIHRQVEAAAETRGLKVLDLYPALSAYHADQLVLSENNMHFSPYGNQATARQIFEYVLANYPGLFERR